MPKFFVSAERIQGSRILLDEYNTAHLKALRLRQGEAILVSDGMGTDYECVFDGLENGAGVAAICARFPCETEPDVQVALFAALPKGDKTELILQKAVELGVWEVCFFLSSRCVSRPDAASLEKRMARLARVSEEAAMQSGRGRIPAVKWLSSFREMAEEASKRELGLFLWEEARDESLRSALKKQPVKPRTIALITGPEGGFSGEEAEQAVSRGLLPVTLGKRILRCETAPICALSAVMYETANLE